jgi:hypothetical protein
MTPAFDPDNKIQYFIKEKSRNSDFFYLLFLVAIILLSFVLYVVVFASPSGTDVYTHMYNTQNMANSKSLSDFYDQSLSQEYAGFDYPFGLWYFGSTVMKITGLDVYAIAYVIPLILIFILLGIFFCYASELTGSSAQSILSLIFLVSMTQIALSLLNYSTSIFVMPFLVAILFLAIGDIDWKKILLISILIFTLCFSHTGTFLFLIIFAVTYFLLRAAVWGKFDINFYIVILAILFSFIIAIGLFPFVQPQYIDKGSLVISTTATISSVTHIPFFKDAGQIFYDSIFVANNYVFAFLWAALLFGAGESLIFIHHKIKTRYFGGKASVVIPFIGSITSMPKGIAMTPFWVGPLHTLFSIIGVFKLDERGKCIALSLVFSALIPGALSGAEGTGSIRETFYLFLLIPVTAALGFYYIIPALDRFSKTRSKRAVVVLMYSLIFVYLIAVPVLACLYYQPPITMTKEENVNLGWLANIGNQQEGVAADAYRDRMTMYANKTVPSISAGTETKQFSKDLVNTYFSRNADDYTKDLSNYQIQYLIMSDRNMKSYSSPRSALAIDSNNEVDKIYASGDFFGFYKIISPPEIPKSDIRESMIWDSKQPGAQIQEIGSLFKFENPDYKVKISDASPQIRYIGTPTRNSLGEGGYYDSIDISWGIKGNETRHDESYSLGELFYTDIQRSDNEILYKTKLLSSKTHELIASLSIKYIFNDLAVKREITVTNDLENAGRTMYMDVNEYSSIFAPMTDFAYHQTNPDENEWVNKKVYPAQDSIVLKDRIIDSIFYNYGTTGLYVLYDETTAYPNRLWYSGSTQYDYGAVTLESDYTLRASESTTISQYFSVSDKATATKNAEEYNSVSAYPFKDAQVPLVITGTAGDANLSDTEKAGLATLSQNQIPYTLALPVTKTVRTIDLPGIIPVGYFNACYNQTVCKESIVQQEELNLLKENTGITGILTSPARYDLNTIKSLSENKYDYTEMLSVPAPDGPYYHEGIRNPKFAYIDGENTGIVQVPVTQPSSSVLSSRSEPGAVFSSWNETINAVRDYGGVAAFLWDPSDIGNPEFTGMFEKFINDATSSGVTITTPDAIAAHLKELELVHVNVTRGDDYVILNARNSGGQRISGITYKLIMPVIDDACPYIINDGKITRSDILDGKCRVYASFSLDEFESKEIKIALDSLPKQLVPYIPELYQGKNTIKIVDTNNQPVKNASVHIDSQYYETNNKGEVSFSVNFGWRTITIEKAGYIPVTMMTYVKPLLYRYTKFMNEITP